MAGNFVLMTLACLDGMPSTDRCAEILGVHPRDIDPSFGVIAIDPEHGRYAVQVREEAIGQLKQSGGDFNGPFSNPRIEGFGPREKD
jgi:hypothetical protein